MLETLAIVTGDLKIQNIYKRQLGYTKKSMMDLYMLTDLHYRYQPCKIEKSARKCGQLENSSQQF